MDLSLLLERRIADFQKIDLMDAFRGRRRMLLGGALLGLLRPDPASAGPPATDTQWLARRLTLGATQGELNLAATMGYTNYLEYHLNYTAIDDSAIDARIASYSTLTMDPNQLLPLPQAQVVNELIEATILRSVFSTRQLYQRMVEFWTDHFNIDINTSFDRVAKTVDDRAVIRPNALGTFPALLSASAHSPAMLIYLDNISSVAGNPNENYARELMELHTLSVNGGYTQNDVVEVARCLTGWTVYPTNAGANSLKFRYDPAIHDNGQKVVLGHVIPPGGGQTDGDMVLGILSSHPSTAAFISRKLCRWFHSENPPQTLVDAVTATYTSTGGDIKQMLRTLFANANPLSAPPKYKRPYHHYVSALRTTNATINSTSGIRTTLSAAGHLPFNWGPPDGYPDSIDNWVGLILPRWNFGASLMNTNISGTSVNIDSMLSGATTAAQIADRIDQMMFGGTMPANQKSRITSYLLPDPPTTSRKRDAVGLAIAAPAFQWY